MLDQLKERLKQSGGKKEFVCKMRSCLSSFSPKVKLPDWNGLWTHFAREEGAREEAAMEEHTVSAPPLETQEFEEGDYVVSVTSKKRRRVLHRIGGCPHKPGQSYFRYNVWGQQLPTPDQYDDRCLKCWKTSERKMTSLAAGEQQLKTEGDSSSESEGSSSTVSESLSPLE